MPYFGLTHVKQKRESFTTENVSFVDVYYDDLSTSHFFARMGIGWIGQWQTSNWGLTSKVGAEYKRSLQDDEFEHDMSVVGSTAEVSDIRDRNHFKGYIDLSAERGPTTLSLGASIDKADGLDIYGLWFQCSYRY